MNDSPDALNANTLDAALEAGLRAYFASESSEPPDPEQFWQRLAPRLEPRAMPAATAVAEHPASSRLDDRYLEHLDGDDQPPVHMMRNIGYDRRSRRLRRTISTFASLAAVVLICLAAVAIFSQFGRRTSLEHPNGKIVRSGLLSLATNHAAARCRVAGWPGVVVTVWRYTSDLAAHTSAQLDLRRRAGEWQYRLHLRDACARNATHLDDRERGPALDTAT